MSAFVISRRLWDCVQSQGPGERQDRGHQEGEARPDRGRSPHVRPQGDLAPQTARKIQPPQYCQVSLAKFLQVCTNRMLPLVCFLV